MQRILLIWGVGLVLASCLVDHSVAKYQMPPQSISEKALARTWTQAYVYFPSDLNPFNTGYLGGRRGLRSIEHALAQLASGASRKVAIYLHGCGGFGNSGKTNAQLLAKAGFIVFAPDSFARPGRIRTCDGKRKAAIGPKGSYGAVIDMRIAELNRALARLGDLPWVDWNRLVLFGHSQGSNAVAYYQGVAFRGRIMTGTRCSLGYRAPVSEPALAISSNNDPWFRGRPIKCLEYKGKTALKVVILPGKSHVVARTSEGKRQILKFLEKVAR